MQRHASFITTDPDGGILPEIGLLLKKGKYKIKVLDLNTLSNSDTFNVFEYMHSELDVDRVLEAVTEATKEVEKRPGTILDKSRRLIGSLSYCVFMV